MPGPPPAARLTDTTVTYSVPGLRIVPNATLSANQMKGRVGKKKVILTLKKILIGKIRGQLS